MFYFFYLVLYVRIAPPPPSSSWQHIVIILFINVIILAVISPSPNFYVSINHPNLNLNPPFVCCSSIGKNATPPSSLTHTHSGETLWFDSTGFGTDLTPVLRSRVSTAAHTVQTSHIRLRAGRTCCQSESVENIHGHVIWAPSRSLWIHTRQLRSHIPIHSPGLLGDSGVSCSILIM